MTDRIYYNDSYLTEFTAEVEEVLNYDSRYAVILNRSAFYPESGGQPSDSGFINEVPVLEVIEKDGRVLHMVSQPIAIGTVQCRIDFERRFDHMQQHTGQHILSASFYDLFDGETSSFHIGSESSSIEINIREFDQDMAGKIEAKANGVIYKNLAVKTMFVDNEELSKLPLRKQPKVDENIRIVIVEGTDYSPCGGTHVKATGEVGIIKIKRWDRNKDGIKFEFVCGNRALKDYQMKNAAMNYLGAKMSARENEVEQFFNKLQADFNSLQKQFSATNQELLRYHAADIANEAKSIKGVHITNKIFPQYNMEQLKLIAQNIIQKPSQIVLFACVSETAQILFSRSDDVNVDMGKLLKSNIGILEGKGGGSPKSAQGGGSKLDALNDFMEAAEQSIIAEI